MCWEWGKGSYRHRTSFLPENRSGSGGSRSVGIFFAYNPVYSKRIFDITGPFWVFQNIPVNPDLMDKVNPMQESTISPSQGLWI